MFYPHVMCMCVSVLEVPLSKHQRGFGLSVVVAGGRAADEHGGPAVSSQRILQDPGHLTVTVRHVSLLLTHRRDVRVTKQKYIYVCVCVFA